MSVATAVAVPTEAAGHQCLHPQNEVVQTVRCPFTKSFTRGSEGALKHLAADLSGWAQCWGQVKELFQRQVEIKSVFSSESSALCLIKKKQQHGVLLRWGLEEKSVYGTGEFRRKKQHFWCPALVQQFGVILTENSFAIEYVLFWNYRWVGFGQKIWEPKVEVSDQGHEKADRKSDSFLSESKTFETFNLTKTKICFPPEQYKLMLETLLKDMAERSCHFLPRSNWCSPLLPGCSCRLHYPSAKLYLCLLSLVALACFN